MQPLTIVLWKWSDPEWPSVYSGDRVNIIADSITRNLSLSHQIFCITDDPAGIDESIGIIPIWEDFADLGHCYRRMKIFSRAIPKELGDRIISVDLDAVITGPLDELFSTPGDFVIAKDTQPPTPYNGSFFILNRGAREMVFKEFSADPQGIIRFAKKKGYCACDQAAIAAILGSGEKTVSEADGVYSFKGNLLKSGVKELPANTKMVFFHGNPKPWDQKIQTDYAWVRKHYRKNRRALLVLGGAACLWDDLKGINPSNFDILAVNDAGCDFPGEIKYWASLHPENFGIKKWIQRRKDNGFNQDFQLWAHSEYPVGTVHKILRDYWKCSSGQTKGCSGSSGLFGVQIGLSLGYDYILLAGVPMQPTPHYFDSKTWDACDDFTATWVEHLNKIKGKVFSLSGWTKSLLGYEKFKR